MFTTSQIEEIRKKLQLQGVKDSSFPPASPLKGNETVAIVQQGQNRSLGLKEFIEKVGIYTLSDFINLSKSKKEEYTLEEAIKSVDPINRKAGQVITFFDKTTSDWSIYQYKGNDACDWFDLDYWDNILAKVDNHFKGWFLNDCILECSIERPYVGDFAFVGPDLQSSTIYLCIKYGEWYNTKQHALEFANKYDTVYSKDVEEFKTNIDETYSDRAAKDAFGRVIYDTYIDRDTCTNYVSDVINSFISGWKYEIGRGTITYDMLAPALQDLFKSTGQIVNNLPDEEDLTVVSNQLKLKNREYKEGSFNGKGYVILRKNITDNINLLEQSMINMPNTIYELRYDFCLNGETLVLPEGSTLSFKGGSLNNGTVVLNGARLLGIQTTGEIGDVVIEGTFAIGQVIYDTSDNHLKVQTESGIINLT